MRAAGEATRDRILAAAKEEFSRHGIAGARINRIADAARASKDRLYAYFPGKDALFSAVIERWLAETSESTALRADDLPGYVGRLFDDYRRNPENARLQAWVDLEGDAELPADDPRLEPLRRKVEEIRRGQRAGHVDRVWDPVDLLVVLADLARSMALPTKAARGLDGHRSHTARRKAAIEAARRLVEPHQ